MPTPGALDLSQFDSGKRVHSSKACSTWANSAWATGPFFVLGQKKNLTEICSIQAKIRSPPPTLQFGPIQIWPIQFLDLVCVMVGGPKPRNNPAPKGRAPKGGRPKISRFFFFPSPAPCSLFLSLWVSSRGFLVVFGSAGRQMITFGVLGLSSEAPAGFHTTTESPNGHI